MTEIQEIYDVTCGCDPFPAPAEGAACGGCSPKEVLTRAEETILTRMRAVKGQVRPIAERLAEIQGHLGADEYAAGSAEPDEEWKELTARLHDLRAQWKEWSYRLEEAIENKLIALGHREPRA